MLKQPDVKRLTPPTLQLVCCTVQGEEYCLEMSAVRSIGRAHQMMLSAETDGDSEPANKIGWVVARENKFPVFDLAQRLSSSPPPGPQEARMGFVILINALQPFALRVDSITGNIRVDRAQIAALPRIVEPASGQVFKGVVKLADKWLLCANTDKLYFDLQLRPIEKPLPSARIPARAKLNPAALRARTRSQVMLFSAALNTEESTEALPMMFGLSITQVQEITDLSAIIPVPSAPHYVYGITNWRNVPLPIIDLQARLGLSETPVSHKLIAPKSRLLIARAKEGWVGFPIKPQVKAFPLPIPYQPNRHRLVLDQDLVKGIFDLEGTPLLIPDLDAVLTQKFVPQPQPVG